MSESGMSTQSSNKQSDAKPKTKQRTGARLQDRQMKAILDLIENNHIAVITTLNRIATELDNRIQAAFVNQQREQRTQQADEETWDFWDCYRYVAKLKESMYCSAEFTFSLCDERVVINKAIKIDNRTGIHHSQTSVKQLVEHFKQTAMFYGLQDIPSDKKLKVIGIDADGAILDINSEATLTMFMSFRDETVTLAPPSADNSVSKGYVDKSIFASSRRLGPVTNTSDSSTVQPSPYEEIAASLPIRHFEISIPKKRTTSKDKEVTFPEITFENSRGLISSWMKDWMSLLQNQSVTGANETEDTDSKRVKAKFIGKLTEMCSMKSGLWCEYMNTRSTNIAAINIFKIIFELFSHSSSNSGIPDMQEALQLKVFKDFTVYDNSDLNCFVITDIQSNNMLTVAQFIDKIKSIKKPSSSSVDIFTSLPYGVAMRHKWNSFISYMLNA